MFWGFPLSTATNAAGPISAAFHTSVFSISKMNILVLSQPHPLVTVMTPPRAGTIFPVLLCSLHLAISGT